MSRHRRVYRSLCRLRIANLPNQDHVGILTEDRSKHARKRQTSTFVSLDLRDAVNLVLDRILDRYNVHRLVTEFVDETVERGRLAASGWPDDKENSLRAASPRAEFVFEWLRKSDVVERHRGLRTLEQANDNLLTPARRQRRNPRVVGSSRLSVDVAILGNTPLGNIKPGDHLDADHDVVVKPAGQFGRLPERAMHTTADSRGTAPRLDVNVAGTKSRSLLKDSSLDSNNGREVRRRSGLTRSHPLNQRRKM